MLTEVVLPDGVPGQLFRSPMPGRWDWPFKEAFRAIMKHKIDLVVVLANPLEIETYAPRYARMIDEEDLPWEMWDYPIPDEGVPEDNEEFLDLARDVAEEIREGARVLIHCYAGSGRTGTLATCVLMALGMRLEEARVAVRDAGAGPETLSQERLVEWAARALSQDSEVA